MNSDHDQPESCSHGLRMGGFHVSEYVSVLLETLVPNRFDGMDGDANPIWVYAAGECAGYGIVDVRRQ